MLKFDMGKFENIKIDDISNLKKPTIYFYLINNGFSQNYIKKLRNTPNSIILNDKFVTIRQEISIGDTLKLLKNPDKKSKILECDGNLEILFEDDDYLVVNKPHNLACMPTRSHYTSNLGGQICKYMNKEENFVLRIINRLDKETAGIVVVAKNTLAYNNITLNKTYYALCEGNIAEKLTINEPILTVVENGINQHKRIVSKDGKNAITHVFPIKNFETFCLVKLVLETGRTHQIRVHMSHIGHPLVGDCVYGKPENHAFLLLKKISFVHFRSKKLIEIEVPFPNDWTTKNSHIV